MDASRHCSPRSQLYLQDEQTKSRRRCSADIKVISFHRYKTYFARLKKNFPRFQNGTSHVMRKKINRGALVALFWPPRGPKRSKRVMTGACQYYLSFTNAQSIVIFVYLGRGLWLTQGPETVIKAGACQYYLSLPRVPASTTSAQSIVISVTVSGDPFSDVPASTTSHLQISGQPAQTARSR